MNQDTTATKPKDKEDKTFDLLTLPPDLGGLALGNDAEAVRDFRRKMQEFTKKLNTAPDKDKIRVREEPGQKPYKYLPISTVEKDLFKMYFGLVQFEILNYYHVLNEVVVTARIKVFHPVIYQWLNYDGIGAGLLQQDAKTKVADFIHYKKGNSQKLASPNAYAEAIKNGAKKIGKRFGSDLNREFEDFYSGFNIPVDEREEKDKPLN